MVRQGVLYLFDIYRLTLFKSSGVSDFLPINSFIVSSACMDIEYAKKILEEIRNNYNLISEDFSRTRNKFWREMNFISDYSKDGDKILDLGCGNGRLSEIFQGKNIDYWGIDFSNELIEIAKKRYPQLRFQAADALNLPFPDDFFDKVFSIAVLHHIPSRELRIQFLKEIKRVLGPRGVAVISVWRFSLARKIKLLFKSCLLHRNLDWGDVFVPWKGELLRYVHMFSEKELAVLSKEAGFKIVRLDSIKREKGGEGNLLIVLSNSEQAFRHGD